MTSDVWTTVASTLQARLYADIAKALRAREYDAESVETRQSTRCVCVAVPFFNIFAWWGVARDRWEAVLYLGAGQLIQIGEFVTDIPAGTTDVEEIAERIVLELEVEVMNLLNER